MVTRVGYVGAGMMGSGIVKNLCQKGFRVGFVVHRNRERVPELLAAGAEEVRDYGSLAAQSDVVMLTVPDSSVVEPLLLGQDGLGPHLRSGHTVVDMSTSYPASTRKIAAELEPRGIALLDAPLTGSRSHAESGTLNVMCGGPCAVYEQVKPLFDAIAANVFYVGLSGSGHAIKLVNNYLGQVAVAATCEMLTFAQKYGVSLQALLDVVSVSGGNSRMFQNLVPRAMKRDFSPTFLQKYVHKDVRYITTLARENGVPLPLGSALLAIHDMALAMGYGDEDYSALLKFMEEISGARMEGSGN
jgi:3-hydroxyisobutyrate dehydrogenase-like beta-hydroxyacid dehydrogenase